MLITSEEEYNKVMAEIESIWNKGFSKLSVDEDRRLEYLSNAAAIWEMNRYKLC